MSNGYNIIVKKEEKNVFETKMKYPTNEVEDFNSVYCSFYKIVGNAERLIGTRRLLVKTTDDWQYKLVVNNGTKIYKYDVDGDSPTSNSNYDGPISSKVTNIEPLTYQIFKADGTELTEAEYLQCKYTWYIPENSLFKFDKDKLGSAVNGYYVKTGSGNDSNSALNYDIEKKYDKTKAFGNILLQVDFLGNLLDNIVNISFIVFFLNIII